MTDGPTPADWEEAENVAGARFRYRSATDRERVVERIAYALAEERDRASHRKDTP